MGLGIRIEFPFRVVIVMDWFFFLHLKKLTLCIIISLCMIFFMGKIWMSNTIRRQFDILLENILGVLPIYLYAFYSNKFCIQNFRSIRLSLYRFLGTVFSTSSLLE